MKFQSNQPYEDEHKISGGLKDNFVSCFSWNFLSFFFRLVANGIFVQKDFSIRDEFKDVVENVYKSDIKTLDFRREPQQAANIINE